MTAILILAALLVSVLAYRLARLPAAFRARDNVNAVTAQALTGTTLTLAQQTASVPWAASIQAQVLAPVVPGSLTAGQWYDPTKLAVQQTFNEFGFITSPLPAPVNPKTGAVPLTNADICGWVGHIPGTNPCARCGVPTG